jgi:hypothetical protein
LLEEVKVTVMSKEQDREAVKDAVCNQNAIQNSVLECSWKGRIRLNNF